MLRRVIHALALAGLFLGAQPNTIAAPPEITTHSGAIQGVQNGPISIFRGIPYAEPPTGELRWREPRSVKPWSETLNANHFGAVCPQHSWQAIDGMPMSEDCLTLNIWTPDLNPKQPLPVMLWIHGGSFKKGTGAWAKTEASRLARKGVVVVTINYRLGYLGRFAHPDLSRAQTGEMLANYGIMDQIEALRWVHQNIAAFGGAPGNITIFGYSAGAVSTNFLMATPASKGLFRRAIAQSSAVTLPKSRKLKTAEGAQPSLESEGEQLAEKWGVAPGPGIGARLRALSTADILSVPYTPGSMNPVVDGRLVVEDLGTTFREGRMHPVDYMAGVDSWESSLTKPLDSLPRAAVLKMFTTTLNLPNEGLNKTYGKQTPLATVVDQVFADMFHASTHYLAKKHADAGHNSYLYWFTYLPELAAKELPGVPHGGEVPYVFGNLDQRDRVGNPPITETDRKVSERVMDYWTRFAKTGNPNAPGLPTWPRYDQATDAWLIIDREVSARKDLLKERIGFHESTYE